MEKRKRHFHWKLVVLNSGIRTVAVGEGTGNEQGQMKNRDPSAIIATLEGTGGSHNFPDAQYME